MSLPRRKALTGRATTAVKTTIQTRPLRALRAFIARHPDILAIVVLAAIAILVCGPHVLSGGFSLDDWFYRGLAHFTGFGGTVRQQIQQDVRRPVAALYFATVSVLIGSHIKALLLLAVTLRFLLSAVLYAILKELRFGRIDAVAIAALTLLFPYSDSLWLWATAAQISCAIVCVLLGFLLNLYALRDNSPHTLLLRISGLGLITAGILNYESVATIGLASGALYLMQTNKSRALRQWGIDIVVLSIVIVVFTFHAVPLLHGSDNHTVSSFAEMRTHVHVIFSQSIRLVTLSLLPFGTPSNATALGLLGLLVALALVIMAILGIRDHASRILLRWLVVLGVGFLLIGIGYTFYIPSNIYYVPLQVGNGNRVNGSSAIGYAVVAYAAAVLFATLIFRGLPRSRSLISALAVLIAAVIGVGYARHVDTDKAAWHQAAVLQSAILSTLNQHIQTPAHDSSIVTLDAPTESAPGVPVFDASWDLTGAVQLKWNDPTLQAYPMAPGMSITCAAEPLVNTGGIGGSPSPWHATYPTELVDIETGAVFSVTNRHECVSAATKLGVLAPT